MENTKMNESAQSTKYPAVSVIIPAYNTEEYIAECLDSLLAQTIKDFEAICIDDGSTDKSLSIFNEYAARDPRIKVLSQKNQGVVAARNNAIAAAHGEYIFPLDSDDMLAPDCLGGLYNFITTHNYAVVSPSLICFGEMDASKIHWRNRLKPTRYNMYGRATGLAGTSMYQKTLWEKYGGYDHLFDKGMEDYDFLLNFLDDGQKVARLLDCTYYYRHKPNEKSRNWQAHKHNREVRDQLLANLRRKHPRIVRYRLLYKIINPLHKLLRFLLRWGITDDRGFIVRVCKFTVYSKDVTSSVPTQTNRNRG